MKMKIIGICIVGLFLLMVCSDSMALSLLETNDLEACSISYEECDEIKYTDNSLEDLDELNQENQEDLFPITYDSLDSHEDIYYVSDNYDLDKQSIEIVGNPSNHELVLTSPWSYHAYDPVINKIRSGFPWGDAGGSAELIHLDEHYGEQKLIAWAYPPLGYAEVYRSLTHYGGFHPPKSTTYSFNFKYRQKGQMDLMGVEHPHGESMALGRVYFRFYLWDGETTSFDTGDVLVYRELCNGYTDGFPYDKTRYYSDSATLQKDVLYTFGAIGRAEIQAGAGPAVRGDGRHTVDWSDISTSPTLRWSCDDPDGNYDSLKYDVYLGTSSSPPLVKSGVTSSSYSAGSLIKNKEYYWKIKAIDNKGSSKTSSVWSFTTKDDCCFPAGTKITMADGSYKNIEDIRWGDCVLSYDFDDGSFSSWKVRLRGDPIRPVYEINDGLLSFSRDHPIFINKLDGTMGWAAVDANDAKAYTRVTRVQNDILSIEIGDHLYTQDGKWIEIKSIEYKSELVQLYNIMSFSGTKTYFANDILVFEDNPPFSVWWENNFYIKGYLDAFINHMFGWI